MTDKLSPPEGWKTIERPPSVFRRFEFASYADTRDFLDRLAELSKSTGLFPDLGFGKTHVNVTVHGADTKAMDAAEIEFAANTSALFEAGAH